ncbi:MAG: VOC family protein [Verrucomicrobia bacterium]|nr:VOC family protein [Verrucomicrobiota bacterium]
MNIQVKEIAFTAFPVADIARARDFYERLLGLKIGRQSEGAGDKWWIEYDIAGATFAITNMLPATGGAGAALMLEVSDLDGAHAAIRAAGIPITEALQEYPLCRSFAVKDPDGNDIGFHQHKPAHLIPAFDAAAAQKVAPYPHEPTGGRIVGRHQPADGGRVHLFSATGVFIATEKIVQPAL